VQSGAGQPQEPSGAILDPGLGILGGSKTPATPEGDGPLVIDMLPSSANVPAATAERKNRSLMTGNALENR
jgi:hypothetical protein